MIINENNFTLINKKISSKRLKEKKRILIGVVGPPCSGKSTFSSQFNKFLIKKNKKEYSKIIPMDGFHFDNVILKKRNLLARKGDPITFDVNGFIDLVKKIKFNTNSPVALPVFDRDLELSRGSADIVQKNNRIIIIEGNYLLLKNAPWNFLKKYIDIFVFLNVDKKILHERSKKRWKHYGVSKKEILKKVKNDMNSVKIVLQNSNKAHIVIEN